MDREYAVCYSKNDLVMYLTELRFSRSTVKPYFHFHHLLSPIVFTYREACNIINLLYSLEYFPKSRKLVIEKVDLHV